MIKYYTVTTNSAYLIYPTEILLPEAYKFSNKISCKFKFKLLPGLFVQCLFVGGSRSFAEDIASKLLVEYQYFTFSKKPLIFFYEFHMLLSSWRENPHNLV